MNILNSPGANREGLRRDFQRNQIVLLTRFLSEEKLDEIRSIVFSMRQLLHRRNIIIKSPYDSARRMSTLGSLEIGRYTEVIPELYFDKRLLFLLSDITGETVLPVPDKNERFVINALHCWDDIQGPHIDIYPYALNIVISHPPDGEGGCLLFAKGAKNIESLSNTQPLSFQPGDVYFLKTDESIHMVSSLKSHHERIVLNFAYTNAHKTETSSYSSSVLYGVV